MVATQPVDFRRGINGLTALVAEALAGDPYCGDVFFVPGETNGSTEASGLGWKRHDPGDEMARGGPLRLACDQGRLDASDAVAVLAFTVRS